MDFRIACGLFSAEEVGANHRRERMFVLADYTGARHASGLSEKDRPQRGLSGSGRRCDHLADADSLQRQPNGAKPIAKTNRRHDAGRGGVERKPYHAPGPESDRWIDVLDEDPLLAPALGEIDLWTVARRNLGLPLLERAVGRRGGMARDLDPAATARLKSAVRRVAHVLAGRVDRLRFAGNGVCPLAAALAYRTLSAALGADH